MNAPLRTVKFDLQGLIKAIEHNHSIDSFAPALSPSQWDILGGYLTPFALNPGQVLIEQGVLDRTIYMVESGTLSVHYQDDKERIRLAVVGPGSAVGEGSFFTRLPRSATVQANGACKMWCLTPIRFTELCNRQPNLALEISMALGSLVTRRLANKPKRVAVT
jgi:CRP/FNR family transcriptional regulator, cyclic AMP receptor protein